MKRYLQWAMFAAAALALVLIPCAAPAGEELPFKVQYTATPTGESEGPYLIHTGTGAGTYLGHFSVTAAAHLYRNGRVTGWVTFTSSIGDSLDVVMDQTWDAATTSYKGSYTIVGGTGRFENASGSGTIATSLTDYPIPVSLEGHIIF